MKNFSIEFENPWFLLLLIPAIALTLIPYFRSPKKYRKTRNRITSMVLHGIIMVLAISVLSGISFNYEIPNKETEVILLIDKSESGTKSDELKDTFVYDVLNLTGKTYKVGVVTFGYDQVYAAPLSDDALGVYNQYLAATLPDTSATNIASALTYAASLFTKPEAGRIVLITDGIETDGAANAVIKNVAAQGIKVDTVHFPNEQGDDVQIISSKLPDHTIKYGEAFMLTVDVQSSYEGDAVLTMYDDATQIGESKTVRLEKGIQTVEMEAILPLPGLHKLSFEITSPNDTQAKNNIYNSYVNIEIFDRLLVIESIAGESNSLCEMMTDKKVTVVNVADAEKMPKTVDELREFDEVILVNISNADMPTGFDEVLYSYVSDIGGGLFTVCGNKEDGNPNDDQWEANAFTSKDMYGSLYQQLLPVEVIDYTPPAAVIIIIDCSGSMYDPKGSIPYEKSRLYAAKQGAEACLDALTERDWVGITTFSDKVDESLALTPRTERDKILAAIESLPQNGGETKFQPALASARASLLALNSVEKKHIIIVTDGAPTDKEEKYGEEMRRNSEAGITMSIVGIDSEDGAPAQMRYALETYAGISGDHFYDVTDLGEVATKMRQDLDLPEIKEVNYGEFPIGTASSHSILNGIDTNNMPTLNGFYGTKVKNEEGVEVVLTAPYVPIYAQWKVGKGMVGSFMCDLNGTWSADMISGDSKETGAKLINNIVAALFPTESIRKTTIQMAMSEQNYHTQMNIFANVAEGDNVEVNIIPEFSTAMLQTLQPSATDGFSRLSFEIMTPGVYGVEVIQKNADGSLKASAKQYKAFSYSQEYNTFHTAEEGAALLATLSESGEGAVLEKAEDVFANIVKYLHKVINPRLVFIIIALVAFLLDVAVRKFKFLWPHEMVRLYKEKKALKS